MQALDFCFEQIKKPNPFTRDICEHLDTLRALALKCDHVTEFGFRFGTSFTAFLAGRPKRLITYDIEILKDCEETLRSIADDTQVVFHEKSTLEVEIEETDLLFIDTLHTFDQLTKELELHGNKARKYLVFHDTTTFANKGEDGSTPGLIQAILNFMLKNLHWKQMTVYENNNGLIVLERK